MGILNIGRRIYYEIETGNIILNTGERTGDVIETTVEQDFSSYAALSERIPETVGVLSLSYGDYKRDFSESNGVRVDVLNGNALLFTYPDPTNPTPTEPVYQPPLSVQVKDMNDRLVLVQTALDELIMGGGL